MKHLDNHGFTLVELMIATMVFSVVLLLCTAGMVHIGQTYYKGNTITRTQNVTRDIMDNVTEAIQFGDSDPFPSGTVAPNGNSGTFCVGAVRYSYTLNQKVTNTNHGLITDAAPASCSGPLNSTNRELLGQNMRLSQLSITQSGDSYDVILKVSYGDDDLIVDNANNQANVPAFVTSQAHCKGGVGQQFCAVSQLETTVQRRRLN